MSEADIAALVERLRAMAQGEARSGIGRQRWVLFRDAAAALEVLQAEVEHQRKEQKYWLTTRTIAENLMKMALDRAEKAEAEVEHQRREQQYWYDRYAELGGGHARCNAALEAAARVADAQGQSDEYDWSTAVRIADGIRALKEKPDSELPTAEDVRGILAVDKP